MKEQPWMKHGSHQMTTLILAHKDDNAILEPSALVVRRALVNKLHYTTVSCEWVLFTKNRSKAIKTRPQARPSTPSSPTHVERHQQASLQSTEEER